MKYTCVICKIKFYPAVGHGLCKTCYYNDYKKRNAEKLKKQNKEWKRRNIERVRVINKKWYTDNVEKHKISSHKAKLKKEYGITPEKYKEMLEQHQHKCAICNKTAKDQEKRLSIDHCHTSGNIRGILCDVCNRGLGYFQDSIANLIKAIDYLKKHKKDD